MCLGEPLLGIIIAISYKAQPRDQNSFQKNHIVELMYGQSAPLHPFIISDFWSKNIIITKSKNMIKWKIVLNAQDIMALHGLKLSLFDK